MRKVVACLWCNTNFEAYVSQNRKFCTRAWHGKNLLDEQLNNQQHQTRLNDTIKDELAKTNNYSLIRIWSDEINNFKFNKLKI